MLGIRKKRPRQLQGSRENDTVIFWKDGWKDIEYYVRNFLDRIEDVFEDTTYRFDIVSNPRSQYCEAYDKIFAMCIQREPYEYSNQIYSNMVKLLTEYLTNDIKLKLFNYTKNNYNYSSVVFLKQWSQYFQRCKNSN